MQGGMEPLFGDVGLFANVIGIVGVATKVLSAHDSYLKARSLGGLNCEELQASVVASGDHRLCYKYARHVPNADIKRLQAVVVASQSAEYCYVFAEFVKGAELGSLSDVVAKSNDVVYCYHFALLTQSHGLAALQAVVRRAGSERLNLMFEKDVPNAQKRSHLKVVK